MIIVLAYKIGIIFCLLKFFPFLQRQVDIYPTFSRFISIFRLYFQLLLPSSSSISSFYSDFESLSFFNLHLFRSFLSAPLRVCIRQLFSSFSIFFGLYPSHLSHLVLHFRSLSSLPSKSMYNFSWQKAIKKSS